MFGAYKNGSVLLVSYLFHILIQNKNRFVMFYYCCVLLLLQELYL